MNSNKVTLAVAGKFHALSLAKEYAKLGLLDNIYCIDRKLQTPGGIPSKFYHNRIDLSWFKIIGSRLPGNLYSHKLKNTIFDEWVKKQLVNKTPGFLHGWNGCSLQTFKEVNKLGWHTGVERSCPHNQFQYDLLCEEAGLLNLNYHQDQEKLKNQIEELYVADTIICPSKYSANSYSDPELIKKLKYVPLGSNFKYRERKNKTDDIFRILLVGNSFLRKGTHYLIEAMKFLPDAKTELWLRGEIPASYRKLIKDPRIKIIEAVSAEKLHDIYSNADVFVQPSIDEGFGMTVLEALSFGLPLVVTENVGAKDVLNEKVSQTVPIRDPEALAKAILAVRNLPSPAFDLERKVILENYSWATCAKRLANEAYGLSY